MTLLMFRIDGVENDGHIRLMVGDGLGMQLLPEESADELRRVRDAGVAAFIKAVTDIVGGPVELAQHGSRPISPAIVNVAEETNSKVQEEGT